MGAKDAVGRYGERVAAAHLVEAGWTLLDRNWGGVLVEGARVYDASAYRAGFATMLAWAVVALVLLALTRETYCRVQR